MSHPRTMFGLSNSGSVAIQVALMLTVLIGFGALGTEVGYFYFKQRQMQAASDAAAYGGAVALSTGHPTDFRTEARAIAANAGYVNGVDGVTVAINSPPVSGSYTSNSGAVEVLMTQQYSVSLINLFRSAPYVAHARAVAVSGGVRSLYCILALDLSAANALTVENNGTVANPACGVAVNSNSSRALTVRNNGAIHGPVSVHGQWSLSNNATLDGSPKVQNAPVVTDPYASMQLQPIPACTAQSGSVNGSSTTLTAGHFCNGLDLLNNAVVTLGAGAYYIDSKLIFANNVTVNATAGVTLIINGNYAINISNNTKLNLTAPATGPYAGMAIFGSRTASSTIQQSFSNNTVLNVLGVIYFPNQIINYQNNSGTGGTRCTEIVGRIVNVSNNAYLNNDCADTGVSPLGASPSQLAE